MLLTQLSQQHWDEFSSEDTLRNSMAFILGWEKSMWAELIMQNRWYSTVTGPLSIIYLFWWHMNSLTHGAIYSVPLQKKMIFQRQCELSNKKKWSHSENIYMQVHVTWSFWVVGVFILWCRSFQITEVVIRISYYMTYIYDKVILWCNFTPISSAVKHQYFLNIQNPLMSLKSQPGAHCSWYRLQTHCGPGEDKLLTEDERNEGIVL